MGYCTYGGKPVPGNNQASCIGGGGNWVGGETGPDTQVSMPPIGSPIQLPDIGRPPIRPEPDRGIPGYQAPQISQSPQRMWDNTDDFGNRLNTDQFGNNNFGLLRDRAVNKQNTNAVNEAGMFARGPDVPSDIPSMPNLNAPKTDTSKMSIFDKATHISEQAAPLVSQAGSTVYDVLVPEELIGQTADFITDPVKRAEYIAFMKANPGTTLAAGFMSVGAGKLINKAYKGVKKLKRYSKKGNKIDEVPKFQKGKQTNKGKQVDGPGKGLQDKTVGGDIAKVYVGGQVAKEVLDEPFLKSTLNGAAIPGVGSNAGSNAGGADLLTPNKGTVSGPLTEKGLLTPSDTGPAPKNADAVLSGQKSLFGDMQKPGYWSEKVEGGSGSWDNRLFRLGEMMSYMGTPLSKRGDNPSKRWTTASATAATAAAKANKTSNNIGKLGYGAIGDAVIAELKDTPMFSPFGVDMFSKYDEEELAGMQGSAQVKVNALMTKYPAMTVEQAAKQAVDELKLGI